ncbi:uncharacterized protein ACIB01_003972 [Guaruba guarouba]
MWGLGSGGLVLPGPYGCLVPMDAGPLGCLVPWMLIPWMLVPMDAWSPWMPGHLDAGPCACLLLMGACSSWMLFPVDPVPHEPLVRMDVDPYRCWSLWILVPMSAWSSWMPGPPWVPDSHGCWSPWMPGPQGCLVPMDAWCRWMLVPMDAGPHECRSLYSLHGCLAMAPQTCSTGGSVASQPIPLLCARGSRCGEVRGSGGGSGFDGTPACAGMRGWSRSLRAALRMDKPGAQEESKRCTGGTHPVSQASSSDVVQELGTEHTGHC